MGNTQITLPFDLSRPVRANRDGVLEGLVGGTQDYRILQVQISGNQDRVQYLVQSVPVVSGGNTHTYWVSGAVIYQEKVLPERPDELTCTVKEATEWLKHLIKTKNVDEALRWVQIADARQKAERRAAGQPARVLSTGKDREAYTHNG